MNTQPPEQLDHFEQFQVVSDWLPIISNQHENGRDCGVDQFFPVYRAFLFWIEYTIVFELQLIKLEA